ncbi:MAG: translation initiation factor aIF-1A [Candidatus Korarchaeota archaeon]
MARKTKDDVRPPMEGELLAIVIRRLGGDIVEVKCEDGVVRQARIPGKMKKRVWIHTGDILLIAPWEFQPSKADIVFQYDLKDLNNYVRDGQLSQSRLERVMALTKEL